MRLALALALLFPPCAPAAHECRAIDGDTIRCGRERVRLVGIRAPERGERGYELARQRLQRRMEAGVLAIVRQGRDRYGRTLAIVYVNGRAIAQRDVGRAAGRGAPPRGTANATGAASRARACSGRAAR